MSDACVYSILLKIAMGDCGSGTFTWEKSMRNIVAFSVAAVMAFSASAFAAKVGVEGGRPTHTTPTGVSQVEGGSTLDVDLAGFSADGGFAAPTTLVTVNLGAGSTVTGYEYIGLTFESFAPSWLSEFVISVEDANFSGYLDVAPGIDTDAPGVFGPVTGTWGDPSNSDGDAFVTSTGNVNVYVYELFNDSGVNPDATVSSGILRIHYAAVPEPTSIAALGLAGAMFRRRR